MDTQRLLAPPPEKLFGADVPGSDEALSIERDESMIGKTVDSETKNVLRDDASGVSRASSATERSPVSVTVEL